MKHFINVAELLNDLPTTVAPAIFKLLSLEDLKSCRLVNHFWYECCTVADITKREKFVFSYGAQGGNTKRLARYILACRKIRQTIEFRGFSLRTLPLSIWEHLGRKVKSLHIHDCHVNPKIAAEIISRCPDLTHLHLQVCSSYTHRIFSYTTLDNLIAANIKRSGLRSFKLFTRYFPIEDTDFAKIFQIFPNTEVFGRDFVFDDEPIDPVIDFLSQLPESVKKIELRIMLLLKNVGSVNRMKNAKETITRALTRFPKIKALNFESNRNIAFTMGELDKFLLAIQHLESLHLSFRDITLVEDAENEDYRFPAVKYKFLKDLRLIVPAFSRHGVSSRISSEILERCTGSLEYLDLPSQLEMTEGIMDSICTDHVELKALSVPSMRCHGNCDLELYPTSLDKFLDLKYLSFNFAKKSCAELILSTLKQPSLKVFRSQCASTEDVIVLLSILSSTTPLLETLCLVSSCEEGMLPSLHIHDFIKYLQSLKKLRFLIMDRVWKEADHETLEDLFSKCSSLLYLIYPSLKVVLFRRGESSYVRRSWYKENIYASIAGEDV